MVLSLPRCCSCCYCNIPEYIPLGLQVNLPQKMSPEGHEKISYKLDNESQHWLRNKSTLLELILLSDLKAFNPRLSRNDLILGLKYCPVNTERRKGQGQTANIFQISRKHLPHTTNNFHVLPASNAQIWPIHMQRNPCSA